MATAGDAEVIGALKRAVCCACHSIRTFVMGVLFGALVAWAAAIAGLYIARGSAAPAAPAAVQTVAPAVSCPAPIIDTDKLAQVCMDWHHPKQAAKPKK